VCLAIAGVASQSKTKSHISYSVTATSHIRQMGTHEHNPISSTLTHNFAYLDLLQISHTINMTMTELYKAFIVMDVL